MREQTLDFLARDDYLVISDSAVVGKGGKHDHFAHLDLERMTVTYEGVSKSLFQMVASFLVVCIDIHVTYE